MQTRHANGWGFHSIQEQGERERTAMNPKTIVVSLMALSFLASVFAFGGEATEVKGMITARPGETLIVKSEVGTTTVVLTDSTRTKDDKGLFALNNQEICSVVL